MKPQATCLFSAFDDTALAEKAIGALLDHGIPAESISVVCGTESASQELDRASKHGVTTTTAADAKSGAEKGAGAGLAAGALGALASLFIPGFGIVVGSGALATAMISLAATTAAGALTGGVVGYLRDQGVDSQIAECWQQNLGNGGALIAVELCEQHPLDEIQAILEKYNPGGGHVPKGLLK